MAKRGPIETDPPPFTKFTFFLEVGRLLPIPPRPWVSLAERTPAWGSWTVEGLKSMFGTDAPQALSEGTVPGFHVSVRSVRTPTGMPLRAAAVAFRDWLVVADPHARNAKTATTDI